MATETRFEPERIKMLADAVFAIAMTILVLDLKVPEFPEEFSRHQVDNALADALRHDIGQYGAYALSFYVLGMIWLGHVRLFRRLEAADGWMFRLNLFMLLFAGSLPFPTGLLGAYGSHTWGVLPYAVCMILLEASLALMWWHCDRAGLLVDEVDPDEVTVNIAKYTGMIVVFGISIGIAFIDPAYAALSWVLLAVIPPAFQRVAARRARVSQAV